jgi:hypothetical protein
MKNPRFDLKKFSADQLLLLIVLGVILLGLTIYRMFWGLA